MFIKIDINRITLDLTLMLYIFVFKKKSRKQNTYKTTSKLTKT